MRNKYAKKIQDLKKSQRPRERLIEMGVENLSSAELLAIVLGVGSRTRNVLSTAEYILKKVPLNKLASVSQDELEVVEGIGKVQAGKILASIELGRRSLNRLQKKISSPQEVVYEVSAIRSKSREYLIALYLNARHELISKKIVAIGGLNVNSLEPRDIFSEAMKKPCSFIVLVHNHPSGDPNPSDNDSRFTHKLKKAGKLLGIDILDHIIVTRDSYYSFKEAEASILL